MSNKKKSPDLRTFLDRLKKEHPEKLFTVKEKVDPDYLSTALSLELESRGRDSVVLLEDPGKSPFRLLANIFASHELISFSVGQSSGNFRSYLSDCLDNLIPSRHSEEAPVQEIVWTGEDLDLTKMPVPFHFEGDAGPYITAGMIAAHDPDNGTGNIAYARLQVKNRNTMGVSLHSRQHLWDYHRKAAERGEKLPAAVVIGAHPAVMIAGAAKMGEDQDEYDFAGALLGEPLDTCMCKTVDVRVPSSAEIVIEGYILNDVHEPEGPFGEYTGYLTGRSTNNVFQATAVTMRRDPIFVDVIPGNSSEHLILGRIVKEAWVQKRMKEALPYFIDFHYPSSGTHFHCYVRIDKHGEGYANLAGELLMGLDHYVKLVVVVDKDIDVTDEAEVMWAVSTRMQADRDVNIISNVACNQLDPSSTGGVGAKMIIDATKSGDDQSVRASLNESVRKRAIELIDQYS